MGNFRFSNDGVCYVSISPKKNWVLDTEGKTFTRCRFMITFGL